MSSNVPQKIVTVLPRLPTTSEVLKLYNVHAKKALSQNFLLDTKLTTKFVSRAGRIKDSYVCEVGPGPGNITRSIMNFHPKHVIVVEKDQRFLPALSMLQDACKGKLSVVIGDILRFEMSKLFPSECERAWDEEECPPIQLLGNLPFSVSLPLIIKWLEDMSKRRSAWRYGRVQVTITVQEEVAVRMAATAGHSQRCRLSVMCQNWCKVEHLYSMNGKAFLPKPNVDVGVVRLTPLIKPQIDYEFKMIEKFLQNLFNMRRKENKFPLAKLFPKSKQEELTAKLLTVADVDPSIYPSNLSIDELNRLIHTYSLILEQYPRLAKYDHRSPKKVKAFNDF